MNSTNSEAKTRHSEVEKVDKIDEASFSDSHSSTNRINTILKSNEITSPVSAGRSYDEKREGSLNHEYVHVTTSPTLLYSGLPDLATDNMPS